MKIQILILCIVFCCCVNANYDVTLAHLKEREGFATVGYVPTADSGCTIGIGIDLGQQTKTGLQNRGISATIITKVEKYLGLKSQAQITVAGLTASKLVLTVAEAEDISKPFIMDSYNVALPYAVKMDAKGLAALVSLRHWAGTLGCTNCKLSIAVNGVDTNYVWNAIKDKIGTNLQLKSALSSTLPGKVVGTATYNRIKHEITYLS